MLYYCKCPEKGLKTRSSQNEVGKLYMNFTTVNIFRKLNIRRMGLTYFSSKVCKPKMHKKI